MTLQRDELTTGTVERPFRTLVLLCQDLEENAPALDLDTLAKGLSGDAGTIQMQVVKDLCRQPRTISRLAKNAQAERLVLGLCTSDYPESEVQARARQADLDPVGVQILDLAEGTDVEPSLRIARASAILNAAIARAEAFAGSYPENLKVSLFQSQQRVSRRAFLTLPPVTYTTVPRIDRRSCAAGDGCDQCVRACPFSALETTESGSVQVNRAACQSCGVCLAVCPHRAVSFPGWSAEEIEAQVSTLLRSSLDAGSDPAIAFVCKSFSSPVEGDWLPVRVSCIGEVPVSAVLQTLAHGARAVALSPCGDGCPTSGADVGLGQVDYCQSLLRLMDDSPERVQFLGSESHGSTPPGPRAGESGEVSEETIELFGRGLVADAVIKLAAQRQAHEIVLEHPYSPLGLVEVDGETCTGCGTYASMCPTRALVSKQDPGSMTLVFDASLCTGCGQCAEVCPEAEVGALRTSLTTSLKEIYESGQTLFQDSLARCTRCGTTIASQSLLTRITTLLDDSHQAKIATTLCLTCRSRSFG